LGRKSIIVSFAGAAARQLIDPLHAHEGCEDDELLVWVTSSVYGVMPRMKNGYDDDHYMHYLDKLRMEAARLIKRHHAAVSLLAHELLLRRSISGRLLLRWAANNGVQVAKCFPLRREAAREYAKAMKREKSRQTH
jgi:hypothetical protein